MGSALLFLVRSRLLVYSAGSGVIRVQVVLSGFSKRLFCFVQAKTLCRYGCMHFLAALVLVCVDVIVMSSACMLHRGSLIRQLAPEHNQFYILLAYVFWKPHVHSQQNGCSWM